MLNRRWWDVTVIGAILAIAVFSFLGFGPTDPIQRLIVLMTLGLFVVGYALFARPEIGTEPPTWRVPVFVAIAAVSICIGVAAGPFLSMLQIVAYPLAWVITPDRRQAILASSVIALAVLAGYLVGGGLSFEAFVSGLTTAGFSVAFAISLGLWITSIAEYGEERARLLTELTAAQAEVEALSRDRGAAGERERLSRDIHDTLAQTLAGLVILAERAGKQSREGATDAAAATIATVEQVAREALAESRALVARTAAVPGELAFAAAVERLAERFRAEAGLAIDVTLRIDDAAPLGRDAQVVLLRCLQEALANVRRHAGATRAAVEVTSAGGVTEVEVSDDGRGFDPDAPRSGFGLDGMGERVALAGGSIDVISAPGVGTTLRVRLPHEPARVEEAR
ncbi:sensor histidine kinase [Microbacterium sp. BK668]|uniref:sensor histidine kinase n=1 Tax=Microbacterium sp. BK668 TaxID=2512118 RepID=UPI00105F27EA|nr:sensor histidine kinase [Microbacterium sp. BK668]TDN91949.1 signal transduction histidine kinase [Microbacterium sp. BK668]